MFDHGVRFHRSLRVRGSGAPNDALIIVAGSSLPNKGDNGQGIVFKTGVIATNASMLLITSAGVGIQSDWVTFDKNTSVPYLSVYASTCDVLGPAVAGKQLAVSHLPGAPQDQPGGLIDRLTQKGYLPNTTSATTSHFTPIAGTWREITTTDGN